MSKRDFGLDRAVCDARPGGKLLAAEHVYDFRGLATITSVMVAIEDPGFNYDHRSSLSMFLALASEGWPAALDEIELLKALIDRFHAFVVEIAAFDDSMDLRTVYEQRSARKARSFLDEMSPTKEHS